MQEINFIQAVDFINNQAKLKEAFASTGLVLLEGLNDETALQLASKLGKIFPHVHADANGIVHLTVREQDERGKNVRGFSSKDLFPHTDRAVESSPPDLALFWCDEPAVQGGESILADGKEVCAYLLQHHPDSFERLTLANSALFLSDNRYYQGAVIEKNGHDCYRIRFRNDDLGFFAGDIVDAVTDLKAAIQHLAKVLALQKGQGYLALNNRWLHGRNEIAGHRSFKRIHMMSSGHQQGFQLAR